MENELDEIRQKNFMNSTIETKALQVIKEEIEKRGSKILQVILFDLKAKGETKEDSDWDF
jgi:hypothetical protein